MENELNPNELGLLEYAKALEGTDTKMETTILQAKPSIVGRDGEMQGHIILARRDLEEGGSEFITHFRALNGDLYSGHYFRSLESALTDYKNRS